MKNRTPFIDEKILIEGVFCCKEEFFSANSELKT